MASPLTGKDGLPSVGRLRAVSYLRVSTAGQVNTDVDPEGISLPAQRAAVQRRAGELGAEIVAEFVEPGRSATSVDARPRFQEMMARIKADGGITYVLVYARSRLHRNSIDAAITKRDLRTAGATLVSVMDYTDDTAIGDLVATVLDGVNEYQSRASGADIAYKMGRKIINGGTVGKARIGYLNVRDKVDGREIRTIAVEPARAPLVRTAFELYATGSYGLRRLATTLADAGLRTTPTRRCPAGTPISVDALGRMLRDRYYTGRVTYRGQEYPGRHQPLIGTDLFDAVQQVLDTNTGTRERRHVHYLKGAVWCHRCKDRLLYTPARNRTGTLYFYYFCTGRQRHTCDLPYLPVERVEAAVLDHHATITFPHDLRHRLTTRLDNAEANAAATRTTLQEQFAAQLAHLDTQEDHLLDLIGDPFWPQDKIAAKLHTIREQRDRLHTAQDRDDHPAAAHTSLDVVLAMLVEPHRLYRHASDNARRTPPTSTSSHA